MTRDESEILRATDDRDYLSVEHTPHLQSGRERDGRKTIGHSPFEASPDAHRRRTPVWVSGSHSHLDAKRPAERRQRWKNQRRHRTEECRAATRVVWNDLEGDVGNGRQASLAELDTTEEASLHEQRDGDQQ